jgi:hypothetical protein
MELGRKRSTFFFDGEVVAVEVRHRASNFRDEVNVFRDRIPSNV